MTALCGGGSSSTQIGVSPAIILTSTAVDAFLSPLIDPVAATVISGIIAASLSFEAADYCQHDPPADPMLTQDDMVAALEVTNPDVSLPAIGRIKQWFLSQYWYQICQCDSMATPTAPAPSNPGPVSQNPGLPQQSASPCWSVVVPFTVPAHPSTGTASGGIDLTQQALPVGQYITANFGSGITPSTGVAVVLPAGITKISMSLHLNEAVSGVVSAYFMSYDSSGNDLATGGAMTQQWSNTGLNTALPMTQESLSSVPYAWGVNVANTQMAQHTGTVTLSFFCPPGVNVGQPCCPPDPSLEQLLRQSIALSAQILASLPTPITSFAEGSVHSGLTGEGTFGIDGAAVNVKVHLDTIPSWVGRNDSMPIFYFDVGYIAFTTVEGSYSSQRITYEDQTFSIPTLGYTINYTLQNGVHATITELVRGP